MTLTSRLLWRVGTGAIHDSIIGAYAQDFARSGEAAAAMEKHRQQLDMNVPRISPDNTPQGQVRLGDLNFWELLRTHEWLKRKRTPAYRAMRDAVYARGMQLQRERMA